MQDARTAIAMIRISKQKRELQAEQEAHSHTRQERDDAFTAAQYLKLKVESLRNAIADLAPLRIAMVGYSSGLEEVEKRVLEQAAYRTMELEEAPIDMEIESSPPVERPAKRQKRRKIKSASSDDLVQRGPLLGSSDGMSIDPALLSSDYIMTSELTLATSGGHDPWHDSIDPEIIQQQMQAAREILCELCETPVARRIIGKAPELTREQLERMRAVLEDDIDAREDMDVFADQLLET